MKPKKNMSFRRMRPGRAPKLSRVWPVLLLGAPLLTWAATPLAIPVSLEVSVSAPGLIAAKWPFEIKAVTASGMQSLGQPLLPQSVALANLNQMPERESQGFANVAGSGHYRLILVDAANAVKIDYNLIFSSTDVRCANTSVSSDGKGLVAENGRWMEMSLLKVEQGRNTMAIAPPILRVCTNSRGKLDIRIPGIEVGKFVFRITSFDEANGPTGAYEQHILIEQPSSDS